MDQLSIIAVSIISIDYRLIDFNRCLPLFSGNCMEGIPSTNHRLNPDNLIDWSSASIYYLSIIKPLENPSIQFQSIFKILAGFCRDFQDSRRIFVYLPVDFQGFLMDFSAVSVRILQDRYRFYGTFQPNSKFKFMAIFTGFLWDFFTELELFPCFKSRFKIGIHK